MSMMTSALRRHNRALELAIKLATLELRFDVLLRSLERRHWRDQPRVPRGNPDGGQWTRGGGAPREPRRVRTAFGAVLTWRRKVRDGTGADVWQCYYRDILDRHFIVTMRRKDECLLTFPADPTEAGP